MSRKLIAHGRWLVTGGGQDGRTIEDGAVVISGSAIADVGPFGEMQAAHPDAEPIGSHDIAILPGLINAHHHSTGASGIQQGVQDRLLETWLLSRRRLRPSDVYLNTLLSAARLLATGVTTVVDVHSGGGNAKAYASTTDKALAAYGEVGLRVAFTAGVTKRSFLVSGAGEDKRFLDSLPAGMRAVAQAQLPEPERLDETDYLGVLDDLCRRYADHPTISIWYGPPGPQWVSDTFMQAIAEAAGGHDTNIQTHVEESYYEKLHGPREYGTPTMLHLRDLGVLSPRFSIAHGVWLTEPEIEVMAQTGAAVSHNPSSNLRLRAGIAPLNALREAGVTVGLGMDGTSINDDEDMFAEMRLALRLARPPRFGKPAPDPADILGLATSGGAEVMRRADSLGRLAPGFKADFVMVKLDRICWPWVAPEVDMRDILVLRAKAGDVKCVFVDGHRVFEDGRPLGFDLEAAGRELAAQLASEPFPAEAAAAAEQLMPCLERHYQTWEEPPLDAYTVFNSKV